MSHLINVADDVYEELTIRKKIHGASYSEVLREIMGKVREKQKTDWKTMIQKARARNQEFKGKKERIDNDLIAYGVSRDRS